MQLHYHKAPGRNFGDDLNEWVWDRLIPGLSKRGNPKDVLFGIGSILHGNRMIEYTERILVMGSGNNGGSLIDQETRRRCIFYAVRGPLTQSVLGLDSHVALLDPGSVVSDLQVKTPESHGKILFIPHRSTVLRQAVRFPLEDAVGEAGLELLSPALPSEEVLERISGASLVISESLHGAIVADAYRVPWIPVKFGPLFTPLKWQDWAQSLEVNFRILDIFPTLNLLAKVEKKLLSPSRGQLGLVDWRRYYDGCGGHIQRTLIKRLLVAKQSKPNLSNTDILNARKAHFYAALERMKADFPIMAS